jgi:hypothetical protein
VRMEEEEEEEEQRFHGEKIESPVEPKALAWR